jgi:hypothetical protein
MVCAATMLRGLSCGARASSLSGTCLLLGVCASKVVMEAQHFVALRELPAPILPQAKRGVTTPDAILPVVGEEGGG